MTFQCEDCARVFSRSSNLKRHKKTCNISPKYIFCDICSIKFTRMKQKNKHMTDVHYKKYICNICGKEFQLEKSLKFHLPNHKGNKNNKSFIYFPSENDVIIPNELRNNNQAISQIKKRWSAIRNFKIIGEHKLRHVYNIRLENQNIINIKEKIEDILSEQKEKYKINASFGSLLYNIENREVRYFHASQNNFLIFEKPIEINKKSDENDFLEQFFNKEISDLSLMKRENTKWKLLYICNVTIYLFRMISIPFGSLDKIILPQYISKNKGMNIFFSKNTNLCFFECIAQYRKEKNIIIASRKLCEEYTKTSWDQFNGVKIEEITNLEQYYNIPIYIYFLDRENNKSKATLIRRSALKSSIKPLYINVYQNHFMFIHSLEKYSGYVNCKYCTFKIKSSHKNMLIQHEYKCSNLITEHFPGGIYKPEKNLFERLENEGIYVPLKEREYRYRIFYDCESILIPLNDSLNTPNVVFSQKHELVSIAFISNVPNFSYIQCYVRNEEQSTKDFVKYIMKKLTKIANKSAQINKKKYEIYLFHLQQKINKLPENSKKKNFLEKILISFMEYINQIPILAFNSKRYDLPLFLSELISFLAINDRNLPNVIKHNNEYKAILSKKFRFLDISNYLSPGISYAQYLKAFNIEENKFFFPYEYLTSISKLKEETLPPHSAFYSSLKKTNISDEEYKLCQSVWEKYNMKTLKDFLIYYNCLDVAPGLKAMEKHMDLLYKLNVDPLKETFSISGVAFLYLFRKKYLPFPLFNNAELFKSIKNSLIGGPSIIFKRYAKVNQTLIKENIYKSNAKVVKKIIGFDANSLYLSVLKNTLPTGFITQRKAPFFNPKIINIQSFNALCWLEYKKNKENKDIYHALYLGEIRVTSKNIPVDGYCVLPIGMKCFQYHGCFTHGHNCEKNKKYERNQIHPFKTKYNLTFDDVLENTLESDKIIRNEGYILETIWDCEWEKIIENEQIAQNIISQRKQKKSQNLEFTEDKLIEHIQNNKIFGIIECDIYVPNNMKKYFRELTPIFKNVNISIDDIGENMKEYCENNNLMNNPRRQLIGSYFGDKIWIMSPLAKWYLDKGLKISKIYQFLEFEKGENFSNVVDEIIKYRRLGDIDPKYEMIGGTFKLIGNSIYGKSILNKNKITKTKYCINNNLETFIRSPYFMNANEIGDEISEIEMSMKYIKQNVPIVLGFSILNYAKGVLLSFFYDFIKKYIPDDSFELIETDTDSLYIAFSEENIEKMVPPNKKKEFFTNIRDWMPIKACDNHYSDYIKTMIEENEWNPKKCCILEYKRECRTPGKWKIEAEGNEMVCLNSKTYILNTYNDSSKISTKGLSKTNKFQTSDFLSILHNKQSKIGENCGFKIMKNKDILTYNQLRAGLSYLYIKRKVQNDGISTEPLDI